MRQPWINKVFCSVLFFLPLPLITVLIFIDLLTSYDYSEFTP